MTDVKKRRIISKKELPAGFRNEYRAIIYFSQDEEYLIMA
jgi:hypothetical protein